jgi:hypothetical protein
MFISSDEYATSANLTATKLTMIITETSYYIKNRQLPIAKLREIIFHNLLFTVVCLEIFRLVILLWKLTFLPLLNFIMRHFQKTKQILATKLGSMDHEITKDDHCTTIMTIDDHISTTYIPNTTTDNHSTITDLHSATTDDHSITTEDYNIVEINYL